MKTEAIVVGTDSVARLTEVELPPMTGTRVRVQTLIGGVSCGTEGDYTSGRAAYAKRPMIGGYQAVGKVVETGALVSNFNIGDMVFTDGGGLWGMNHIAGGSHARESIAEASKLIKLNCPPQLLDTAAYAKLGGVGLDCITRMKLEPGNVLLIFGLGMLGQLAGRLGQVLGLRVIGVNRSAWKCDLAKAIGFDAVCPPDAASIKTAVDSLGFGPAKYAFETTGTQEMVDLALSSLGPSGEISLGGYYLGKFQIDYDACHGRNLTIHNPVGPSSRVPQTVKYIEEGCLNVTPLIRHRINLSEITTFYADLIKNHSNYLGVVIDWQS